jgi:hypothetical protein
MTLPLLRIQGTDFIPLSTDAVTQKECGFMYISEQQLEWRPVSARAKLASDERDFDADFH